MTPPAPHETTDHLPHAEYRILRDTIRTRGGQRPALCLAGLAAWGVALIGVLAWLPYPIAGTIPLLLLVSTFEVCRVLHLGVERIGRYLQVFYEEGPPPPDASQALAAPAWERTAMAHGAGVPGAGGHPLFVPLFLLATVINLLSVILPGPVPEELAVLAVPHAAFVIWMLYADRGMRLQRVRELERFREIKNGRG